MCELKDFSHLTREERLECLSSYWTIFVNSDDGDKEAFACIYKLSIDDLYSYGLSLGADEDTCEDIIHESTLKSGIIDYSDCTTTDF